MAEDQPRQLAVLQSYDDLLATLRARRDELDIANEIIDEIAGLTRGHASKLLGHRPSKFFSFISWSVFEALGMRVIVVEDAQALARAQRRSAWRKRQQTQALPTHAYPGQQAASRLKKSA
jgi:hypothetical protein